MCWELNFGMAVLVVADVRCPAYGRAGIVAVAVGLAATAVWRVGVAVMSGASWLRPQARAVRPHCLPRAQRQVEGAVGGGEAKGADS
jgi:hypothetical protein